MTRRPPHILVTTPESLYLLLTSDGGRRMLSTVRTVIVDEIHALYRDKRGSHLALSLERLEALTSGPSSASACRPRRSRSRTSAAFSRASAGTAGSSTPGASASSTSRSRCPPSPLATVCSHEQWDEIYARIDALVREHRTTLVFVNTRKMAERLAGKLTERLGADVVTSHHGSLSRERRLDAEERLKSGRLRALVATASLELGIDIGDVDLVIQIGATRSIATFLQRIGRSGHALVADPEGPALSADARRARRGRGAAASASGTGSSTCSRRLPRRSTSWRSRPSRPASPDEWKEDDSSTRFRRAWPYRDLTRARTSTTS